jgi:hypothetical protein
MSRRIRPAFAALVNVVAALAGCTGDFGALGLSGTYAGVMTSTIEGDVEVTPAAGDVFSAESSSTQDADATFVVEAGTESDAVLIGFADCVVALDRAGDTLVLQRSVECVDDMEHTFEFAGADSEQSSSSTLTIVDVAVREAGEGRIAVDVLADYRESGRDADGTKTTIEGEQSAAFDGVRVAY